jgi:hypothetical protein
MSEYRFLCPQCGRGFPEGTAFARCPQCEAPLLEAGPLRAADIRGLPEHLDVAALLKQVLAEQQPGEDIEAALRQHVERDYPEAAEVLCRLIGQQLDLWQRFRGVTRQEAAEQLAGAESELEVRPGGTPEVRTSYQTDLQVTNVEDLPPELRERVQKQLEAAAKKTRVGCALLVAAVALLPALGWAVCGG